ncbi:unnamed protein product [Haemonchus placei]|uniref:Integrase catalytic domain-containing protein n=1 Tax=Haemonchus placei TaxID=6290 RepID=A0A0N4X8Z7_HAEPC|nr:unnamed protein product [Haemonchus placei]
MVHLQGSKQNSLKQLKPQKDKYGILRCRGRMELAELPFEARQPILIAAKTKLAEIIVQDAHSPLHCTTAHTMPTYPEMGDLPRRRVCRAHPFEHSGIDYFGPLSAKENDEVVQVYGIIITCMTTRLLHLELVPDMTTINLLNALRRFFARGVPTTITSDNAPKFHLAEQILSNAVCSITEDTSFANSLAAKGIEWRTITPFAPWQGAFYERLIKSVKYSLYKVMRKTILTKTDWKQH